MEIINLEENISTEDYYNNLLELIKTSEGFMSRPRYSTITYLHIKNGNSGRIETHFGTSFEPTEPENVYYIVDKGIVSEEEFFGRIYLTE